MRFTKDEFINAINTYQTMLEEEGKLLDLLNINPEWIPGGWISNYYDMILQMSDIDPTQDDPYYGNDIDYFVFELEFGKKWKPGVITVDGKDVPMKTAADLWNLLTDDGEIYGKDLGDV